jgi:hypothetical protein
MYPWVTKVGDLNYAPSGGGTGSKSAVALANNLAAKFFGASASGATPAQQFGNLNEFIYQNIEGNFNKTGFELYADASHQTPLSGEGLFEKMAGVGSPNIYLADGHVALDLADPATRASFQVLFGLNPNYMLSSKEGLRTMTTLYMDNMGNIWGAYAKTTTTSTLSGITQQTTSTSSPASVDDYVLVLPAALNPAVFDPNGTQTSFKFPMANVFSMGSILTPSTLANQTTNKDIPYYNLLANSSNSALSIYGLYSPFGYIGNSDSLINGSASGVTDPFNVMKNTLKNNSGTGLSANNLNIIMGFNPNSIDATEFQSSFKNETANNRASLWEYFVGTNDLKVNNIADDMYYFPTNAGYAGYSGVGSFNNVSTSVSIPNEKLFANKVSGGYNFFSGSYLPSNYLKSWSTKDTTQHVFNSLNSILKGAKKVIINRIGVAQSTQVTSSNSIFDIVPKSTTAKIVANTSSDWGFWDWLSWGSKLALAAGLNPGGGANSGDSLLTYLSAGVYPPTSAYGSSNSVINEIVNGSLPSDTTTQNKLVTYFYNFQAYEAFSINSTFARYATYNDGLPTKDYLGNGFSYQDRLMNGSNDYPGMYWGYMVQMLGITQNNNGNYSASLSYSNNYLPNIPFNTTGTGINSPTTTGAAALPSNNNMKQSILQNAYQLLNPSDTTYSTNLIKKFADGFILSAHEAMIGQWSNNAFTVSTGGNGGSSSGVGFAPSEGYINMPNFSSLPFTSWFSTNYLYVYIFLMGLTLLVVILSLATRSKTLREGILIFIGASVIFLIPQFLVSGVIDISNSANNLIFSGKFNYWAIVQDQEAQTSLTAATQTGNSMDAIIAQSMQASSNVYSGNSVLVKWMAPKQNQWFQSLYSSSSASSSILSNLSMFRWLFGTYLNQTMYDYSNPLASYVYRPYQSIISEAQNSYSQMSSNSNGTNYMDALATIYKAYQSAPGLSDNEFAMFNGNPDLTSYVPTNSSALKYTSQESQWINDAAPLGTDSNNFPLWGLQDQEITSTIFNQIYPVGSIVANLTDTTSANYNAFAASTESPFYFFYNLFESEYNTQTSFNQSLLNTQLFESNSTNPQENGQLRDFLDLKDLFTYEIPYLDQANNYVHGYTNIYDSSISGYDFANGQVPSTSDPLYTEYEQQQIQKQNLENVWRLYAPWVDEMYQNNGVLDQQTTVAGKKVTIANSLNPADYQSQGRDMIFSPAQMYAMGYNYSDLTDTESRIIQVEQKTQEDMQYLLNYYNFNPQTVIDAAAMTATFNFDQAFSGNSITGSGSKIYPQGYQLQDFNYDAFLRLIMLNATGLPVMSSQDVYSTIIANTSFFTGITLLLSDVFGVFVVPAIKIVTLFLLFLLSFAVILSVLITPTEKIIRLIIKQVIMPGVYVVISSIGFSMLISLFMGSGLDSYVGSPDATLSVSDPTITLLLLIFADGVYIWVTFKILKKLFISLKSHVIGVYAGLTGLVGELGYSAINNVKTGITGASGVNLGASAGSSGFLDRFTNSFTSSDGLGEDDDESRYNRANITHDHGGNDDDNKKDNDFAAEIEAKSLTARAVDAAVAVKNAPANIAMGLDYMTSGVGFASDVKGAASNTINAAKDATIGRAKDYAKETKNYAKEKDDAQKAKREAWEQRKKDHDDKK